MKKYVCFILILALVLSSTSTAFAKKKTTTTTTVTTVTDSSGNTKTTTTTQTVTTVTGSSTTSSSSSKNPSEAPTGTSSTSASSSSSSKKTNSDFNLTTLRHKTKMEKKAYKSLRSINSFAKKYGWNKMRKYTRKMSNKTWVVTEVTLKTVNWTFTFYHYYHKSGKVLYYQGQKQIDATGVKGVIMDPSKYYKK